MDKSKFKDDKVRIVDVIMPSNDRVNNVTYTYFPSAGQIFCTQRQFVEGTSAALLEVFRKAKDNPEFKKFNETDNYAFFQKSGSAEFQIYHVKAPNGAAVYFDYNVIDVK